MNVLKSYAEKKISRIMNCKHDYQGKMLLTEKMADDILEEMDMPTLSESDRTLDDLEIEEYAAIMEYKAIISREEVERMDYDFIYYDGYLYYSIDEWYCNEESYEYEPGYGEYPLVI